ncbi:ParA family protein [Qipengyuania sediminis]|uniref:ParA family protein n=1 Tax=Qipengyuania sediminis TaxID=1532023 RepID=UPI0010594236|nr:ParA family protein [Qipengyuania sediminis]
MAVIAVYSVKGGVGKTTLAANLAWCASQTSGWRTLLWDIDAASGAAFLLGVDPPKSRTADSVFARERAPQKAVVRTPYRGLDLLPADQSLWSLDAQLAALGKKRRLAKLTETLGETYPRIILDCPPVLNQISAQTMRAADVVIVPLPPSPLSTRAFALVAAEVKGAAKGHPPMLPVLSMVDRRRTLHRDALAANPDWPVIPLASAIEQCAVHRAPIGAFAPSSPAARGFELLWRAIERKLTQRKGK